MTLLIPVIRASVVVCSVLAVPAGSGSTVLNPVALLAVRLSASVTTSSPSRVALTSSPVKLSPSVLVLIVLDTSVIVPAVLLVSYWQLLTVSVPLE